LKREDDFPYRPPDEYDRWRLRDPLYLLERRLLKEKRADYEELESIKIEICERLSKLFSEVLGG